MGIVNDHLAYDKKVPEKWFDGKSKLYVQMASDLWGGSRDGDSSSLAVDLLEEAIPRLWMHQMEESEAQFVKEYLGGGRAINGRYLDIWFRHPELARGCQILLEMRCVSWCCVDKFYPNLDWPDVCKCDSCGACVKETLEHFVFLFECGSYMEEILALFRRIRERLTLGEECDVRPLIRMVLGLDDVLTHETEENQRVLKSAMGDVRPLPDNPSDSVNEGKVDSDARGKGLGKSDERKDSVESEEGRCKGRSNSERKSLYAWGRTGEREVGFVAITPTIKLFSAGSGDLFFTDIGQ